MPYSNDYNQIEAGLVNYIGASLQALPSTMSAKARAHYVTADLMKQVTKLALQDDRYDLFIYRPVFRSVVFVLRQEQERMKSDLPYTRSIIENYQKIIDLLIPYTIEREEPHENRTEHEERTDHPGLPERNA